MSAETLDQARVMVGDLPAGNEDFVSMKVVDQLFGIPVLKVQDVLRPQRLAHIPLAPPEVAGTLNLRGRIVTAIDLRARLGLEKRPLNQPGMSIVVEHGAELYSLNVDSVGEVLSLPAEEFNRNPPTMDQKWREVSMGVYRLADELLVVLDVTRLLDIGTSAAA